jgi:hypothetical protein
MGVVRGSIPRESSLQLSSCGLLGLLGMWFTPPIDCSPLSVFLAALSFLGVGPLIGDYLYPWTWWILFEVSSEIEAFA